MDLLLRKGARVSYNDPHVPRLPPTRNYPHLRLESQPLTAGYLASQDCVAIVADHGAYDWAYVVEHSRLVIDTRGATRGLSAPAGRIVRA
jgi:UDP-N-acetyl-D-glucosamine dehydrogenase